MTDYAIHDALTLRQPQLEALIGTVATNMREADIAEVRAMGEPSPLEAVRSSIAVSRDAYFGVADEIPLCAFGIAGRDALSGVGAPWMLSTHALPAHARRFLRGSRQFISYAREQYSFLENYVDARNTDAVEWLRWLGFTLHDPEPYGPFKLPFHRFSMVGL